jgi:hypothetical protein
MSGRGAWSGSGGRGWRRCRSRPYGDQDVIRGQGQLLEGRAPELPDDGLARIVAAGGPDGSRERLSALDAALRPVPREGRHGAGGASRGGQAPAAAVGPRNLMGDGLGHLELLVPGLVAGQRAGDGPARAEDGRGAEDVRGINHGWQDPRLQSLVEALRQLSESAYRLAVSPNGRPTVVRQRDQIRWSPGGRFRPCATVVRGALATRFAVSYAR